MAGNSNFARDIRIRAAALKKTTVHVVRMASTSESEVSSNGEELLCNYEKERLENIKHNEKMLKLLGELSTLPCTSTYYLYLFY